MLYTIQNSFLQVTVSQHGAELQSVMTADSTQFLWQGDPAFWKERSPLLFPYIGRMTDKSYYLDEKLYHMELHGIAKYRDFQVTACTDTQITLELQDDDTIYASYPRHFLFRVTYTLNENTLEVCCHVENRDDRTMYFGLGGHPGFLVPFAPGKKFTDYQISFPAPCEPRRVIFSETGFFTGELVPYRLQNSTTLPLEHSLFANDAIVLADTPKQVTLSASDGGPGITVDFPQMPFIGFWQTTKEGAPYLCIEPWSSLPSPHGKITVLEEQKDLLALDAGSCYDNTWSIRIDL